MKDITIDEDFAHIKLNTDIYSKHAIITTAYSMLEEAYFLLDKKENYIIINIKPKNGTFEDVANKFCDEILNFQFYMDQKKWK